MNEPGAQIKDSSAASAVGDLFNGKIDVRPVLLS